VPSRCHRMVTVLRLLKVMENVDLLILRVDFQSEGSDRHGGLSLPREQRLFHGAVGHNLHRIQYSH